MVTSGPLALHPPAAVVFVDTAIDGATGAVTINVRNGCEHQSTSAQYANREAR
jgi:hypothetical protein